MKVTVTMCDGCGKEITGKPNEPCLLLTMIISNTRHVAHYCCDCGMEISKAIKVINEKNMKKEGN